MKPTVCCVMLVNGREKMVKRAIQCFRAQTYERKRLLILESHKNAFSFTPYGEMDATSVHMPDMGGSTAGALRNAANWCAVDHFNAHLIAHWDSDDWSHPRRLEEQVALLEASGKQCVGYRECLFWDTRETPREMDAAQYMAMKEWPRRGEAWLYRQDEPRFAIGASMLYRRELWEQQPFPDQPAEDYKWWLTPTVSNNCVGVSSIMPMEDPRMICQIHGANTEEYDREKWIKPHSGWTRAADYDKHCAEVMAL